MSNHDDCPPRRGHHETFLADPYFERDACGTGFLADLHARASHKLLQDALTTIARLSHRGAVAADYAPALDGADEANTMGPTPPVPAAEPSAAATETDLEGAQVGSSVGSPQK
jgi:hypothetical protein